MQKRLKHSNWNKWSERLWQQSEGLWIKRNGQDHFYREQVVLPALLQAINKSNQTFKTLVDLGSGDGHVTNALLEGLHRQGKEISTVILVDRSQVQLEIALSLPFLKEAQAVESDLIADDWPGEVSQSTPPRIFLSVFVFQEIPSLDVFIERVSKAIGPTDIGLAVFVAPAYSDLLRQRGAIQVVEEGTSATEWEWAAMYPISIESKVIFLPHFQRSMEMYRGILEQHNLRMSPPVYLSVPDTPTSREIFGHTIYGQGIIGAKSSVLISFHKEV
jgi:hypothetical protein